MRRSSRLPALCGAVQLGSQWCCWMGGSVVSYMARRSLARSDGVTCAVCCISGRGPAAGVMGSWALGSAIGLVGVRLALCRARASAISLARVACAIWAWHFLLYASRQSCISSSLAGLSTVTLHEGHAKLQHAHSVGRVPQACGSSPVVGVTALWSPCPAAMGLPLVSCGSTCGSVRLWCLGQVLVGGMGAGELGGEGGRIPVGGKEVNR